MITKGYIESVVGESEVTVRCPIFDGIKGNDRFSINLSSSPISTYPGISPNLKSGDVVFVGFEENNRYKPVVLGYLCDTNKDTYVDINVSSLKTESATFNGELSIGNVTNDELICLEGLSESVPEFISSTSEKTEEQKKLNSSLLKTIETHNEELSELETKINGVKEIADAYKTLLGEASDETEETIYGMINLDDKEILRISDLVGQVPEGETIRGMLNSLQDICSEMSDMLEEANGKLSSNYSSDNSPSSDSPNNTSNGTSSEDTRGTPSFGNGSMISRAEQMVNVQWSPKKTFYKWNSSGEFEAGNVYTGMPYSMFSFGYSYDEWKKHSEENETYEGDTGRGYRKGPKYGSCCADFVSEVVGLPSIVRTCPGLLSSSQFTKLTGEDAKIENIKAGDVLVTDTAQHAIWVGSISNDSIVIYEQTPPSARRVELSKSSNTSSDGYFRFGGKYTTILRP